MKILPLRLAPRVEHELASAYSWYQSKSPVVASRFRSETRAAIHSLRDAPTRWAIWQAPDYRRFVLPRFPYVIFYRVLEHEVAVVAFMHQHQDADARFPEDP